MKGRMAMTGLENIIREIEAEGAESAAAIRREAREAAEAVIKSAENAARETAQRYNEAAENAAKEYITRAAANDEAELRRAALKKKQKIIGETLLGSKRILAEKDERYFEMLTRLLEKYATEESGDVILCAGDAERMTKEFETALKTRKLTISEKTLDADGGFIIDYGNIEINCTLEALFDAYSEEISDMLSTLLFADKGGA